MPTQNLAPTGLRLTKKNQLALLKRAREILSSPTRWTKGRLRERSYYGSREPQYCLLGALEQAVYDTGLAKESEKAFQSYTGEDGIYYDPIGYRLSPELGLQDFALKRHGLGAYQVNDELGYERTLALLDDFTATVEQRGTPSA